MEYLLKIHFIILFSLYIFTFIKLYKKGFGFSLGIVIGVLHFIFIPLLILTFTNKLPIDLIGFYDTKLIDVIMSETIIHSLILISYLYSILAYIFIVEFIIYKNRNQTIVHLPLNWKLYFIYYLTIGIFIFVASGIHSGGHWYNSSVEFFQSNGLWILVIIYGFFATKLIFITSLLTSFNSNKISLIKFSLIALLFSLIDVIITGNRIFVFVLLAAVAVILFQRYRFKLLIFGFFIIPFGYLMSIYRIIRGSIFLKGIPSIKELINIVVETVSQEPPAIGSFLLGISESVNFNVLYQIFDYISFETALWGETYLKTFVFFIPRSIWQGKPENIARMAGNLFAPKSEHLSLVTTIIGEMHWNFYIFGILLLPILLFITNLLLNNIFQDNDYGVMLLFLFGILIFRMAYSDMILTALFVTLISKLLIFIKNKLIIKWY